MLNKEIIITKIKKEYDNRVVLNIDNLVINYNEVTAIVGPSGAGKSTLLNLLGTLENLDEGKIEIKTDEKNKIDIFEDVNSYRKEKVGFIFQDMNLIDGLSLYNNVKIASNLSSNDISEIPKLLNKLSLKNLKQNASTLSGGEKQRVTIARALSKDVEIILADEPTGNLDFENANNIFSIIRSLKNNRCVIIITHDLSMAKKYADRIITLKDGQVDSDIPNSIKEKNEDIDIKFKETKKSIINEIKNKLHFIFTLGLNSIKKRLFRLLSISLVLGLTISTLVTIINYNSQGKIVSSETNRNYLEADLVSIKKKDIYNPKRMGINLDSIKEKLSPYKINEYVEDYSYLRFAPLLSYESKIIPQNYITYKQIEINDFFKNRIMNKNIDGNFLLDHNEIIIGKQIASYIDKDNPLLVINKTIEMQDGYGNSKLLKIVGINNVENSQHNYYSYISSQIIKSFRQENIKKEFYEIEQTKNETTNASSPLLAIKFSKYNKIDSSENIINQAVPKKEDNVINIIVSSTLFNSAFNNVIKDNTNIFDYISSLDFSIYTDIEYSCKISAVYESSELEIRLNEKDIDKIFNVYPSLINVYVDNINNVTSIVSELNQKYTDLEFISEYENLIIGVINNYIFFSMALIIVSILFSTISLLMLISLIKLINLERTKEIGIIKSLGANSKTCFALLLFDIFFISLSMLIISLLFSTIIHLVVPLIFTDYSYFIISYPVKYIFLIWLIISTLTIIFTAIFLLKNVKKSPHYLLSING